LSQGIMFCAVPVVAFLSWLLLPYAPLGLEGWRWVALFPAIAALLVWWIRKGLPESPRWLAARGRIEEAHQVTAAIETRVANELGSPLPPSLTPAVPALVTSTRFVDMFRPPHGRRIAMLVVFHVFQAIGFYGFGN